VSDPGAIHERAEGDLVDSREIRADYDRESIVIYQAYSPAIADATLAAGRFVPPFSTGRMTWIKPSFLWLMHRSRWGLARGQERTLAVRITREGWEKALSMAVLTSHEPSAHRSPDDWSRQFRAATVHLQWDTERSLRGAPLPYFSVQVGIGRQVIRDYVESWVVAIEDLTPRVRNVRDLILSGRADRARDHLPRERAYPVAAPVARRISLGP